MRLTVLSAVTAGLLLLTACHRTEDQAGRAHGHFGRYASVGLYAPDKQWTRLVAAEQAKDPQAAQPIDDQIIFVTQDSATGEIRACGDLTGYCIGMNPWRAPLPAAQMVPIRLTAHVDPDPPSVTVVKSLDKPPAPASK